MRQSIYIGGFLVALLVFPAAAQDRHEPHQPLASEAEAAGPNRLDELFNQLRRETNEVAARRIAARISEEWLKSGGATADLLIDWARKAAREEKFHVALDLLDQATVLYPDYVESWNSRAMVHLLMNDYSRAMSDLSRVLTIEPRHFGAMGRLAAILQAAGRSERAAEIYRRMLEVYPMQRRAQQALLNIIDEQADDRI
ncbi:tetratricopeptide repeat protein [Chelativorans sp. Marseille-P2723]|uniref:tetratricopeptide repeat protein n=1 Tax=Chelativorans sp. Marseille-P2723 TaxID=2709133 RepID=UPI00156FB9B3|nr:tetratricopeptide repeat protein [Chelativorans sp. Marseille-P2723]